MRRHCCIFVWYFIETTTNLQNGNMVADGPAFSTEEDTTQQFNSFTYAQRREEETRRSGLPRMKAYHRSVSLGVIATAVCVVSHAAAFSSSGTTRRRRILDAASPSASCTCTVGGRSASASACAGTCSRILPGCYLSSLGRSNGKNSARHVLNLFGVGHSAEPLAATEWSSHLSHSDTWSAASSPAKCNICNDDGAALLRQEGTKNATDQTKSATSFSEVTFTAFILAAVAFCNPAMPSLAWAADDGTAAPSTPPVATSTSAATTTAKSGYGAASAGMGMGMGMGDWSGTGAGGTMQWVPDPVMPPASTSTEKGIGETAGAIDSRSNQEEKEAVAPSPDNLTPPTNEAAQETRRIDNVERAEPTIDEYGLEITETDTRNSQEKQESSKSSSSPLASNDEAADITNDASALDANISNDHSTADASEEITGASTATPPTKPFDYQAAADDLFATTPNIPPSIGETNTNGNKPFDDSRFAMDKDDEEVVEELSFRLYDGRSK